MNKIAIKLKKLISKVGEFIFYSKDDESKDYKEYIQSFKFGFKLVTLLSLLIVPLGLFFSIAFLSSTILEKTPLYTKPFIVTNLWLIKDSKKISADKRGNSVYEFTFENGSKATIEKRATNVIYSIGEKTQDGKMFYIKTNRAGNDAEMQEASRTIGNRLESSYDSEKIFENISKPNGYNEDIYVEYGGFKLIGNVVIGIIIFFSILFCLALYFPIAKAIIRLFKNRKRKL